MGNQESRPASDADQSGTKMEAAEQDVRANTGGDPVTDGEVVTAVVAKVTDVKEGE